MDMESYGLGLSPASATLWPWDFRQGGQGAQGPQSLFLHFQREDNNVKHPHKAILCGTNVFLYIKVL